VCRKGEGKTCFRLPFSREAQEKSKCQEKVQIQRYSSMKKYDLLPYFLIVPGVAVIIFVYIWPLILGFIWSFQYKFLLRAHATRWITLDNYIHYILNPVFWTKMRISFVYAGGIVLVNFIVGLATALALNRSIPGRDIFRAIILIPWMLPTTVIAITSRWIFHGLVGPISDLMLRFGLVRESISFFGSMQLALPSLILLTSWRSCPFVIVMILAAFQAIPAELYEAARVDGAGILHSFIYITLPSARLTIILALMLSLVWNFNFMDFVYIITQGGPVSTTETISLYIYRTLFQKYRFGRSCSLSFLSLLILLAFMYFYIKMLWGSRGTEE